MCDFQLRGRLFQRGLFFFQLHLQIREMRAVRQIQALLLLLQTLTTYGQTRQNVRSVALMCGFEFDLLLRLHDLAARLSRFQLRFAPCLFQRRQSVIFAMRDFLRLLNTHCLFFEMHFRFDQIVLILRTLALPLIALCGQ